MKKLLFVLLFFCSFNLIAQPKQQITEADYGNNQIEMADKLREDGKIYVVVAILVVMLTGLLGYTFLIDRKISALEKEVKEEKRQLA